MLDDRLTHPDDFYQALLDTHAGLSLAESHALNARLVLILASQVGDIDRLRAALAAARQDVREGAEGALQQEAQQGAPRCVPKGGHPDAPQDAGKGARQDADHRAIEGPTP